MNYRKKKITIVTNSPTPYREQLFESLALKYDLNVYYLNRLEKGRGWIFKKHKYSAIYLSSKNFYFDNYPIYYSYKIFSDLFNPKPNQIFLCGMGIPFLYLLIVCKINKVKTTLFIDGNIVSESYSKMSFLIKINKYFFLKLFDNSVVVGKKGKELMKYYNYDENKIFISPLSIKNKYFTSYAKNIEKRTIDIIFTGRFIPIKNLNFFFKIIQLLEKSIDKKLTIGLIGDGPEKEKLKNKLHNLNIELLDFGYVQYEKLPQIYGISKIMLITSFAEPWGMVANECMASGVCVLTSKFVGAADDLIINEYNGFVLDFNVDLWVMKIIDLLTNKSLLAKIHFRAMKDVKKWSNYKSLKGIINSVENK